MESKEILSRILGIRGILFFLSRISGIGGIFFFLVKNFRNPRNNLSYQEF